MDVVIRVANVTKPRENHKITRREDWECLIHKTGSYYAVIEHIPTCLLVTNINGITCPDSTILRTQKSHLCIPDPCLYECQCDFNMFSCLPKNHYKYWNFNFEDRHFLIKFPAWQIPSIDLYLWIIWSVDLHSLTFNNPHNIPTNQKTVRLSLKENSISQNALRHSQALAQDNRRLSGECSG